MRVIAYAEKTVINLYLRRHGIIDEVAVKRGLQLCLECFVSCSEQWIQECGIVFYGSLSFLSQEARAQTRDPSASAS